MFWLRRVASVIFVLAFLVSTQVHAMPMMASVKAAAGMAALMHGSPSGDCKRCGQDGMPAKAGCVATCAAAFAVAPQLPAAPEVAYSIAWIWASDPLTSRATAPDTSPPRS